MYKPTTRNDIMASASARYYRQRIIAETNMTQLGRSSPCPGVSFVWGHTCANPWSVRIGKHQRVRLGQFPSYSLAASAVRQYRKSHAEMSQKQKTELSLLARMTTSRSGFRSVFVYKSHNIIMWRAKTSKWCVYFPFSALGKIAAAICYDSRGAPLANFLSNGYRNPASMIRADRVCWIRGEYVEPILTLSATERAELVALLVEKNVTVPEYLKPKP